MSYLGAYQAKYEYPDTERKLFRPEYKIAGVEPHVVDADTLDPEIADIGAKLGEFEQQLISDHANGVKLGSGESVLYDEILSNRINIIGGNESASTVEPEVRRIFGEYQTAAWLDALSDSDNDDDDTSYDSSVDNDKDYDNVDNDNSGVMGGDNDNVDNDNIDNDNNNNDEKNYKGITYYEVDNANNNVDTVASTTATNTSNDATKPADTSYEGVIMPVIEEAAFDISEFLE
jgi:hypothetical protein